VRPNAQEEQGKTTFKVSDEAHHERWFTNGD